MWLTKVIFVRMLIESILTFGDERKAFSREQCQQLKLYRFDGI